MGKNIPGIHNYCDRWCERCTFTSRCAVYESESTLKPEQKDMHNQAFWDHISDNLQQAMQMLAEAMKKHGYEPGPLTEQEVYENRVDDLLIESHPLSETASAYSKLVSRWLKENQTDETSAPGNVKQEYLEVIEWYQHFIAAKIHRALHGKQTDDEFDDDYPKDYNGSAKVALIAIKRSMQAWAGLYAADSEDADILEMLAMLEKMQRFMSQEFPEAQDFVRPGFDG